MRWLFLILILAIAFNSAIAERPPATYMGLKAKCRSMSEKEKQVVYIRKQVIVGVATGAAIFAMNEYFIWTRNDAFHSVMPYVAVAYTMYQTVNIIIGKSVGEQWDITENGGLTFYLF